MQLCTSMNFAMYTLAKIHLLAANEALMNGDTTAAFSQVNLAYLQLAMLEMEDMGILNQNTSYEIYAKRRREIIRHNYGSGELNYYPWRYIGMS